MSDARKITESPVYQGANESIVYIIDFSNWGTPSSPTVTLFDSQGTDVSSTKLSGSPSVSNDTVITPTVISLVNGEIYTMKVRVTIGSSIMEAWLEIIGEA